ncbi:E3 SUMO-protein ligase ZBED1-like [Diretmus argenteus]
MLEDVSSLALTADAWTSRATESYLGVSCHYMTTDWHMKTVNLSTMPLEERHTAANIVTWMEEILEKYKIPPTKIKAVVHDNGANIVAAMRLLEEKHGWASVRCAGHTLQLIIKDALKDSNISRAVSASRSVAGFFHHSELASTKLKAKQKQMGTEQHAMIQDVSTRWNSTFYMMQRLLEQRWPVTATLSDPDLKARKNYLDLKADQWVLLEELVVGLEPFETATKYLSGQEYPTASCLPKLVKGLERAVQKFSFETSSGKAFRSNAKKGIGERWESLTISAEKDLEQDQDPVIHHPVFLAAALDPRYRKLLFLTAEDGDRLKGAVQVLAFKAVEMADDSSPREKQGINVVRAEKSSLDVLLNSDTDSQDSAEEVETLSEQKMEIVRHEVQRYFTERPLDKNKDPLEWWRENEKAFPTLSNVAKSVLCIPATSTPAERIFSAAGNICSQKRASLTPEHVEMLTFLTLNSKL